MRSRHAGGTRPYRQEDQSYDGVVCQAIVREPRGTTFCWNRDVTKEGRYKMVGGWWDVYRCPNEHRFGIKRSKSGDRAVMDIETRTPVFGQ